jgi:hypothetical protein
VRLLNNQPFGFYAFNSKNFGLEGKTELRRGDLFPRPVLVFPVPGHSLGRNAGLLY